MHESIVFCSTCTMSSYRKFTFAISSPDEFLVIISTAPELMKLIFAVLDVSLTMGLTRCYKTEGFFTFISTKYPFKSSINTTSHNKSYDTHSTRAQLLLRCPCNVAQSEWWKDGVRRFREKLGEKCTYAVVSHIMPKTRILGLHFCYRHCVSIFS